MIVALSLSNDSRTTAGILLLTIVAVEFGGLAMLRIVRGHQPATEFQRSFARAGHAHAGVFVVFALVAQILADAADPQRRDRLPRPQRHLGGCRPLPRRLLLSSAGRGTMQPNRLIVLVHAGAVALTAGLLALGIGLLTA